MGYQALLFCPDEKTARTVTQVLGELEFGVEACTEPFAAVKKLMGRHFDALVVDCDNEQNATLLFKSARNSTSNQTSLAVAVVEGQAGVAKAFRFGANLVLTKPINVEQAKGTLRVARGLLRKGDTAKPAPATPAAGSAAPAPVKDSVSGPEPKPTSSETAALTRPATPTAAKSAPSSLPPKPVPASAPAAFKPAAPPAVNASAAGASDDDLLELGANNASSAATAFSETPAQHPAPVPTPARPVVQAGPVSSFGSGAASAPAPALKEPHAAVPDTKDDDILEMPAAHNASESYSPQGPETTFTFGGAAVEAESSGGSKKVLLAVAAVVFVVIGGYFGWNSYQSRAAQTAAPMAAAHPAQSTQPAAPSPATQPLPAQKASATLPGSATANSQITAQPPTDTNPSDSTDLPENDASAETSNAKKSTGESAASTKPASKPASAPLVVKSGHVSSKAPADASAPSVLGMAVPASSAPPLNLAGANASAPRPVLEKLNVSQGVSQGLLVKKVNPVYPRTAMTMHVEGTVELLATVSKNGDITAVKVLSGDGQLTKAATDAVKQWKYKPYLLNGEPVEIQTQVTINFRLPK